MPLPAGYEWNDEKVDYYQNWQFREQPREEIEQERQDFDPTGEWDWQNENQQGPGGEALPEGALGWRPTGDVDWGTGLGGWWKKTMYNVGQAYLTGREEGVKISGLSKQIIQEKTLGFAGGTLTEEQKQKTEAAISEKQKERKPETELGAELSGAAEALKASFGAVLGGTLEALGTGAVATEQALGSAGYALSDIATGQDVDWKRNWEAARMAYAGVFDASIREEMNRLVNSGVRGDLAAEEVLKGNKNAFWAQLGGQLIFDPLNALSVFTKAGDLAQITKNVKNTFHVVENPALREIVEGGAEALSKMDDAQAYRYLDDLARSQQGLTAATAHAEDIAKAEGALEEVSKSYKLASLTNEGKIAHVANQTSEILMHVVNNSDPDEAFEVIRGMVMSVDPDKAKAAEGVAAMMRFTDSPALFSEAGNNTTVLLSKMFTKHGDTLLTKIEELKGNKTELTKYLLGMLDEAGQDAFPSVADMLKAEDAVRAGGELSEKTLKLAERAKELPAYVRTATKFHERAQKVVGPANKFFSSVYMGWSPGYAFRNWSNNTLQMLIDHGPGVLAGRADDVFAKAEKMHGGTIMGAHGFGAEVASLFPEKVTEGATGVKAVVEAVKKKGLSGPFLGPAEIAERNGAKRIIAKSYMDTFNKGVTAMTRAVAPQLKAAGFSDDFIKKLPTYIMQNEGDIDAVMSALRTDAGSGVIDLFDDITRIDPKYKGFLESTGKWDDYAEKVLRAPTREEAQAAAAKIFDELAQAGDYVYRDQAAVGNITDARLAMAVDQGEVSYGRAQLVQRSIKANDKAIEAATGFIDQADSTAFKFGLDAGALKPANFYKKTVGNWGETAAQARDRLLNAVEDIKKNYLKSNASMAEAWRKFPELFGDAVPDVMTKDVFMERMWSSYFNKTHEVWGVARDEAVGKVLQYFDNIETAGGKIPKEWRALISEAQDYAKQFDNVKMGRYGEIIPDVAAPFGTRKTQIADLAKKYDIATASEQGVPLDKKILAMINKYANPEFKQYGSLDEVPLSVAEEAFKKRAGKAAAKAVEAAPEAGKVSLTEAAEVPRDQLPPEVSARFEQEARRLMSELSGGEAGKRTAEGAVGTTNVPWYRELYQKGLRKPEIDRALDKIVLDAGKDQGVNVERMKELILDNMKYGDTASGTPPDLFALKQLGADDKTLQEALDNFNDITKQELSLDEAIRASAPSAPEAGVVEELHDPDLPYFDEAGNLVDPKRERILPAPDDDAPPTLARAIYDQKEDVTTMRKWMLDDIEKNFGKKQITDKVGEQGLKTAERELRQKLAETRLVSSRVAQAQRDFTLLNYGEKSYWDTALAYLYPYHFWYKGTYKNWLKRLATNPAVLSHYNRYKENLGTLHAGMPEWWRYNLNTNDLPGVNVENPLYFNLEATLWPLNGITGTDFNDPSKRVNWWTKTLDFANKFGPTTWAPINILTGLALYQRGEKEAGEKWMGRLIPQSATVKAAGSLLGVANLETDPLVLMFQGGLDPYERRRVQRALAEMGQEIERGELPYTREQLQDAAYSQTGEIWDAAVKRAVHGRAKSQLSSFFAGVGFKGRTNEDMEIDKFYGDYSKLWTMRPNLKPEEFKEGMSALKDKYPFMDTLLLSRRDDVNRDAGLAYLVLGRIPPGQSSEIAKAAGIDPALLDKFFADKGQIDKWSAADRQKFMGGVMTMSAVLEIPTDMTRKEWERAKAAYSGMSADAEKQFGSDILDLVDGYYAAKTQSYDAADAYLEKHPEVSQYMNWKAERVMGSDLLSAYYGGASMIEGYYKSKQYADIEAKLGKDIFEVMDEYYSLKNYGTPAEAKAFYRQHKGDIGKYYEMKEGWEVYINQKVAQLSAKMPEGEDAGVRQDYDAASPSQTALAETVQGGQGQQIDFAAVLPERLQNLMQDYFYDGERLPESAEKQLGYLARDLGFGSAEELLQAYGTQLYQGQP